MNRVQLCGLLRTDPDFNIKKSGSMMAYLLLETHSSWQTELGTWQYSAGLHHITVYNESFILFLQGKVKRGDQLFVQGILTYGDNDEMSRNKKRNVHIIVPRQNGLIFKLIDGQTLSKTPPFLPSHLETANENKSPKNVHETE